MISNDSQWIIRDIKVVKLFVDYPDSNTLSTIYLRSMRGLIYVVGNLFNFRAQLINLRAQIKYFEHPRNITSFYFI